MNISVLFLKQLEMIVVAPLVCQCCSFGFSAKGLLQCALSDGKTVWLFEDGVNVQTFKFNEVLKLTFSATGLFVSEKTACTFVSRSSLASLNCRNPVVTFSSHDSSCVVIFESHARIFRVPWCGDEQINGCYEFGAVCDKSSIVALLDRNSGEVVVQNLKTTVRVQLTGGGAPVHLEFVWADSSIFLAVHMSSGSHCSIEIFVILHDDSLLTSTQVFHTHTLSQPSCSVSRLFCSSSHLTVVSLVGHRLCWQHYLLQNSFELEEGVCGEVSLPCDAERVFGVELRVSDIGKVSCHVGLRSATGTCSVVSAVLSTNSKALIEFILCEGSVQAQTLECSNSHFVLELSEACARSEFTMLKTSTHCILRKATRTNSSIGESATSVRNIDKKLRVHTTNFAVEIELEVFGNVLTWIEPLSCSVGEVLFADFQRGCVNVCLSCESTVTMLSWDVAMNICRRREEQNVCYTAFYKGSVWFSRTVEVFDYNWHTCETKKILECDEPVLQLAAAAQGVVALSLKTFHIVWSASPSVSCAGICRKLLQRSYLSDWRGVRSLLKTIVVDTETTNIARLLSCSSEAERNVCFLVEEVCEKSLGIESETYPLEELSIVAQSLTNNQLFGVSAVDQTMLFCVVEGLRLSSSVESLKDHAEKRFLIDARVAETKLRLKAGVSEATPLSVMWLAISESQDWAAAQFLSSQSSWNCYKTLKCVLWFRNVSSLCRAAENIGRTQFQASKDVRECALMYCLANKRNLLAALCKASNEIKLQQFFLRDFSEEKNRAAAVSNAFVALSKGNITFGAAFFVIVGDGRSAAQTVLERLGDFHLAVFVLRVVSNDNPDDIAWLMTLRQQSAVDTALLLWRAGQHVDAMIRLRESEVPKLEVLEILRYASRNVAVLSRRKNEFFRPLHERELLYDIVRFEDDRYIEELRSVAQMVAPAATVHRGVSQVNYNSGTLSWGGDSDDEQNDEVDVKHEPETSTVNDEDKRREFVSLAESLPLSLCHRPSLGVFRDPYEVDVDLELTEAEVMEAVFASSREEGSNPRVLIAGTVLLLTRWAQQRSNIALSIALVKTMKVWLSDLNVATEKSDVFPTVTSFLHALELTKKQFSEGTELDQDHVATSILTLFAAWSAQSVLSLMQVRALPVSHGIMSVAYTAAAMYTDSELTIVRGFLFNDAEPSWSAEQRRKAKELVWNAEHSEAKLSSEEMFFMSQQLRDYLRRFLFSVEERSLKPFNGVFQAKLSRLLIDVKNNHLTVLLENIQDSNPFVQFMESTTWERVPWKTRRNYVLITAIDRKLALLDRSTIVHADHAISSVAVDRSTFDSLVVCTNATSSLFHGVRELLAGDNPHTVNLLAAQRNATMSSLSSTLSVVGRRQADNTRCLGSLASATAVSHPQLPFFCTSHRESCIDVFSFGDECVVSSVKFEDGVARQARRPTSFSSCGTFLTVGSSTAGELFSWKFEDVLEGVSRSAAATVRVDDGICKTLTHLVPHSSVVMCSSDASVVGKSKHSVVKIADILLTSRVLSSCEVRHAVDFVSFDFSSKRALCLSADGMASIYDLRKNSIAEEAQLIGKKSKASSITAVEQCLYDDLLAIGSSDGTLIVMKGLVPFSLNDNTSEFYEVSLSASSVSGRNVPVVALSSAPSAMVFGLGDGRCGCVSVVPEAFKSYL